MDHINKVRAVRHRPATHAVLSNSSAETQHGAKLMQDEG